MTRCRESATLIYPGQHQEIIGEISECSFGEFEGKDYKELKNFQEYQQWLAGFVDPPLGEGILAFRNRVWNGFEIIMEDVFNKELEEAAVVLHGGSIMVIMGSLLGDTERFYDFQVKNGRGFCLELAQRGEKGECELLSYREL
jgi:alpha-ribazole phosphatase